MRSLYVFLMTGKTIFIDGTQRVVCRISDI